jgi:hypothetical protein
MTGTRPKNGTKKAMVARSTGRVEIVGAAKGEKRSAKRSARRGARSMLNLVGSGGRRSAERNARRNARSGLRIESRTMRTAERSEGSDMTTTIDAMVATVNLPGSNELHAGWGSVDAVTGMEEMSERHSDTILPGAGLNGLDDHLHLQL